MSASATPVATSAQTHESAHRPRRLGRAILMGLGEAVPPHTCCSRQTAQLTIALGQLDADQAAAVQRLADRCGVARRASVVLDHTAPDTQPLAQSFFPSPNTTPRGPSTAERLEAFARHAPPLAAEAAMGALASARCPAASVSHIVTVSCTGFIAPGLDVLLMQQLGLAPSVERLNVAYMGCHGAINGLRAAAAIARSAPSARVLVVCVELCTLHMQYTQRVDQLLANLLFADGAAAAMICGEEAADELGDDAQPRLEIAGSSSHVIADTQHAMRWDVQDHGFAMTLGPSVPSLIQQHLAAFVRAAMHESGLSADAPQHVHWAVHPGGPRVLDAAQSALSLPEAALTTSRAVLRDFGNMSSGTVLFILQRLLNAAATLAPRPAMLLAFGPGLSAECLVLVPARSPQAE